MDEKQLIRDTKICTRWALGLTAVLIIIWPGIMFATGYVYSLSFFKGWYYLSLAWLIIAGIFITTKPLLELLRPETKE